MSGSQYTRTESSDLLALHDDKRNILSVPMKLGSQKQPMTVIEILYQ